MPKQPLSERIRRPGSGTDSGSAVTLSIGVVAYPVGAFDVRRNMDLYRDRHNFGRRNLSANIGII